MLEQPTAATQTAENSSAEDAQYFRAVLHELIDIGLDLARTLRPAAQDKAQAAPEPANAEPKSVAYDRIARAIRRSIMLAQAVAEARPAPAPAQQRTAARRQILRTVEDAIELKRLKPEQAEGLRAELHERLDTPDFEDDLRHRPILEIVAEIRRDLGLDGVPGHHAHKRRTPADIAALNARAAQPPASAQRANAEKPSPADEKPSPAGGLGAQSAPRIGEGGITSRNGPPTGQATGPKATPSARAESPRPQPPPDIIRPPKVERQDVNRLIRALSPNST